MQHQLLKYIVLEDAITLLEANLLIFMLFKTCMIFHITNNCFFFCRMSKLCHFIRKKLLQKMTKYHKLIHMIHKLCHKYYKSVSISFVWGLHWHVSTFNPPCLASSKYVHISKVCRDFDIILQSNVRKHKSNVLAVQNKPWLPSSINSSCIHRSWFMICADVVQCLCTDK